MRFLRVCLISVLVLQSAGAVGAGPVCAAMAAAGAEAEMGWSAAPHACCAPGDCACQIHAQDPVPSGEVLRAGLPRPGDGAARRISPESAHGAEGPAAAVFRPAPPGNFVPHPPLFILQSTYRL